jgi:hypothetical protein
MNFIAYLYFAFALTFVVNNPDCPDKIKWKKIETADAVVKILIECVPLQSDETAIGNFLDKHKISWSEHKGIIYAKVLTRSKSVWIEKQWLMEFILDENRKLKEIKVEAGLTGP